MSLLYWNTKSEVARGVAQTAHLVTSLRVATYGAQVRLAMRSPCPLGCVRDQKKAKPERWIVSVAECPSTSTVVAPFVQQCSVMLYVFGPNPMGRSNNMKMRHTSIHYMCAFRSEVFETLSGPKKKMLLNDRPIKKKFPRLGVSPKKN